MVTSQNQIPACRSPSNGRPFRLPPEGQDGRADGHVRSVSLTRDMVRIDRSVQGIAMRVAVPVRAYRGVALSLQPGFDGTVSYKLQLVHDDRDLSVALDEAEDDRDILADWQLWTRFFRLPALVERRAGLIEAADPALGPVLLGQGSAARRQPRSALKHRPRFLRRRKAGVVNESAPIHAGERELIARR
jgi:Family of unknown function (DUF6101)